MEKKPILKEIKTKDYKKIDELMDEIIIRNNDKKIKELRNKQKKGIRLTNKETFILNLLIESEE